MQITIFQKSLNQGQDKDLLTILNAYPVKMPKKRTYPYTLFCLERKQSDHRLKGKSLKELCDLLGPEWEQLGPDERQGYVETAKQINAGATHFPNGPPVSPDHHLGFLSKSGYSSFFPKMHSQKKDLAGKFDNMGQSLLAQRIGQEQKQCKICMCFALVFW